MKPTKTINVYSTTKFPCQWDDLVIKEKLRINSGIVLKKRRTKEKKLIATIYTEKEAKKDNLCFGIKKAKDNIYDIVVDATEINNEVVRNALQNLERETHKKYKFVSEKTNEDKIIDYADNLMEHGEKFRNKKGLYDFTKAKNSPEKTLIIRSWIGELLYEALVYKNPKALKSLEKTINIEIKELLKNK